MRPDHDVMTLFREANPVPDLDLLTPGRETASDYLTSVMTRESLDDTLSPRAGWRLWTSIAAAIGAIGILAILVWSPSDDPIPIGTTPPTTTPAPPPTNAELASDWVGCVLGDCVPGAVVDGSTSINGESATEFSRFRTSLGTSDLSASCEGETPVICTVTGTDLIRETFGQPFTETWEVEIVDAVVVSAIAVSEDAPTFAAYEAWLEETYPDEMATSPLTAFQPWLDHAEEFMESDAWVRPYEIDIVGTWEMLKGEIWTFDSAGVYSVADRNGVYETGTYVFDEPNIAITATDSGPCPTGTGTYELRFFSADSFAWVLIEDECGIRGSLLSGLANRSE